MEINLLPTSRPINKTRLSYIREDAATLREIESLYDHGLRGEQLGKAVEDIIQEMRAVK